MEIKIKADLSRGDEREQCVFFKRLHKIIDFFKAAAECNSLRFSRGFFKIKPLQAIVKKPGTPWVMVRVLSGI